MKIDEKSHLWLKIPVIDLFKLDLIIHLVKQIHIYYLIELLQSICIWIFHQEHLLDLKQDNLTQFNYVNILATRKFLVPMGSQHNCLKRIFQPDTNMKHLRLKQIVSIRN
eukprot:NODE_1611_length_767_cov_0.104790.p2 type:complete len:110 gc:universal NODE_1611_length_767_cov_0.104790:148-477(+)